ncbi:hypothetical protein [Pseudomonas urmiensis]|uniref:Uncharacterized protein n=1 Tax=Pseudomonas urmiensis TaxID=2745493 RepID=A0A923JZ01_9PSED|nr:hypothetical protein [Pseudomonas urmiensis]MBV4539431.1 hypothetical protein [Pseudomonas urmiensis]
MFKDYLSNPETYDRLEEHLINTFKNSLAKEAIQSEKFLTPHYIDICVDGTRLRDANPIFSVRNTDTGNILRIVISEGVKGYSAIHNDIEGFDELCLVIQLRNLGRAIKETIKWAKSQSK